MKITRPEPESNNQKKKKSANRQNFFYAITAGVVILISIAFFFWHQRSFESTLNGTSGYSRSLAETISVPGSGSPEEDEPKHADTAEKLTAETPVVPEPVTPSPSLQGASDLKETFNEEVVGSDAPAQADSDPLSAKKSLSPPVTSGASAPLAGLCETSSKTIKDFYLHLDNQEYIRSSNISTSSEEHFTTLIQRLINNPPVVTGEMNDLFTILQNTAHFFRIIGKDNILILKGILDQEKESFENVLSDFHTLLHIPGCAEQSFSLQIPQKALYDYAGFFLNSMGGRLYLFRRDSKSRLVVSYYAILLINHANKNASNEYGIDIGPHIRQLIEEIEGTSNILMLKDTYLDKLYELLEDYQ